jgi:hypothetical protein
MKVQPKVYKGIEYIQFIDLPEIQRELLKSASTSVEFIKILIDGKIVDQCIQYKDYIAWFNTSIADKTSKKSQVVPEPGIKLALDKA